MINDAQHLRAIRLPEVKLEHGLCGKRQGTNRERTIQAIYHQIQAISQAQPHVFWDSGTVKWIRAVSYSLANIPNPLFKQQDEEVVDLNRKSPADGQLPQRLFFCNQT